MPPAKARNGTERRVVVTRDWTAHPAVDNIPGLFAILGPDGVIEAANRRITEYCGQTGEELKNWGTNGTLHPDDLAEFALTFAQSIATGAPYHVKVRVLRFDGAYRWFDSEATPVRDDQGQISCWYVLLTEIDDLKSSEVALRESQRNLELIINAIPVLVWSATPDGSADFFNKQYQDFVGLAAEHLQGAAWMAAVHPDDLPGLIGTWRAAIEAGALGQAEARMTSGHQENPHACSHCSSADRRDAVCERRGGVAPHHPLGVAAG